MEELSLKLAMIGVAGIGAQWAAWRWHLPAIVLLFVVGLLFGPVTGFLNPARDFETLYRPAVSMAVAIVLFEGGLTLNFREVRETTVAVRRVILGGGVLVWLFTALAAHFLSGLSWPTSIILGAVLVVTGPTVIIPLLRQAHLKSRPASILRWEAIINDPIGALFAVIAFETLLVMGGAHEAENFIVSAIASGVFALVGGVAAGYGLSRLFARGHAPEYLKSPILFVTVLGMNAVTNLILHDSGLLTVTVMGVTMANLRLSSISDIRRFKETITTLLVSGLFIILTAALTREEIALFDWRAVLFVLAVLFVVRPLAIFIATLGTGLPWRERVLVGWIAPRGIVAVAVAGLFGASLSRYGVEDGPRMLTYTFAVVAASIVLHGFSLKPMARAFDLVAADRPGVLLVGASRFSIGLARRLKALGVPTLIADSNWSRLAEARLGDFDTWFGEILSENAHHSLNLSRFSYIVAATDNPAYNSLVCTDFGPDVGRSAVFQIGPSTNSDRHSVNFTIGGLPLFRPGKSFNDLRDHIATGWLFQATRLTESFGYAAFTAECPEGTHVILWVRPSGELIFAAKEGSGDPVAGDTIISFGPPRKDRDQEKIARATTVDRETRAERARMAADEAKA
ncbi:cation:proton antiporter [Consotaella salsifontis]|uniref:Sodium/proton antiporter, CPA1 family n=1 Tax=Consotaella salsifontis TaxID=1365950 RepID=A0A1T4M8I1_9HYPH|nr:sodium:proton antiporter [Consotaella salsifontis]SJZ63333.1 sodium/proton antiporter, CPA1 family [Consotaella salsifontis]